MESSVSTQPIVGGGIKGKMVVQPDKLVISATSLHPSIISPVAS